MDLFTDYQAERIQHWDRLAMKGVRRFRVSGYYHRRLAAVYRHLIAPGQRVLEIGSAFGDLLAATEPAVGVGIDFSAEMVARARQRHPALRFIHADAHDLPLDEVFDVVIVSDVINDLWDVQAVFERVRTVCLPSTRVILNFYSRLWELPLRLAQGLHLAQRTLPQNWFTVEDVANILALSGFEMMRHWNELMWPVWTPLVNGLANRFLVKLWPIRHLGMVNMVVARPRPTPVVDRQPTVSIIVPARNEAGIMTAQAIARIPELGGGSEIIFVEGGSADDTYRAIQTAIAESPGRNCRLLRQPGKGKADAVRLGFEAARGDIVTILDADLTMPPEDLTRYYRALVSRAGEFINGVRLVYPMQSRSMRFLNLLGNKFFSMAFTAVLGQPVKDTLCGTKMLWRKDYLRIAAQRSYFGEFDPFGDFDLLLGAAKLNLKIVDMPIRYRARTYGKPNIRRFHDGFILLRALAKAARKLKFV